MTNKKIPFLLVLLVFVANSLLAGSCVVRVLSCEQYSIGADCQVENLSRSDSMPQRFTLYLPLAVFAKDSVQSIRVGEILKVTAEQAGSGFNCLHFEIAPAIRAISDGNIEEIILAGEDAHPDLQGMMTVLQKDGRRTSFIVHKHTLILVRNLNGNLYAGRLNQLKTGWKCSVGYDLPEDDGNQDFICADSEHQPKIAENMIVDYAPPAQ